MTDFSARVRAALKGRGISLRAAARDLAYDPAYLSRVLSGKQQPSPQLLRALDSFLGANGALVALAAAATDDDRDRVALATAVPGRVDGVTVTVLADVLAAQRRAEDVLGPGSMVAATDAQLPGLLDMVREVRGPHRQTMLDLAAQWAAFTGWLYVATGRPRRGGARLATAGSLATEASDPSLGSMVLGFQSYAAGKRGDLTASAELIVAAREVPHIHPALATYNRFKHARSLVDFGETEAAARLLAETADMVDAAVAVEPPPWGYWYSRPFFLLQIGLTEAWLGRMQIASDLITTAVNELPPDQQSAEWLRDFTSAVQA